MVVDKPRFWTVHCFQCGGTFGPGDSGYSHCEDHAGLSSNDTAWSLSAVWMADMADVLEHVRHEDGGPKLLTPDVLLGLVNELREDRDHWKKRGEAAEFSLGMCRDELAAIRGCQDEEADFVAAGGLSGRQR